MFLRLECSTPLTNTFPPSSEVYSFPWAARSVKASATCPCLSVARTVWSLLSLLRRPLPPKRNTELWSCTTTAITLIITHAPHLLHQLYFRVQRWALGGSDLGRRRLFSLWKGWLLEGNDDIWRCSDTLCSWCEAETPSCRSRGCLQRSPPIF